MNAWSPVDLLPGLYVGLVGLSFAALLRRWLDPLPQRIAALFLLALLPLFGPVLFGGKVLLPLDNLRGSPPFEALPKTDPIGNTLQGDLLQLVLPSQIAVREALADGAWPLWNPRAGAGMPLLADPQAQAFQPLVFLGAPFPPARTAGVVAALRVFFALAFFFLFLRRQGVGEGPAVAGAFAYGLGGFVLLWVGWPLANSAVWLPAVLWGLARCDEEGGRKDLLLLTLAFLGLLLAGHPETIVYVLALAGAFLASRTLRRPSALRGALLRRTGLAFGLALLLAAPLLLPAAELLPESLRAARLGVAGSQAEGPSFVAGLAKRLVPLAVPNAFGNDRFSGYWGLTNINEDASGFAGTATLLALFAGWAGLARGRRLPQERTALLVLALGLLVLAWPMGLDRLLRLLPFGAGLGSRRLLLPLLACIAFLGAAGLERFRRGEGRLLPLVLATLGLAGIAIWGTWAHGDPADPGNLDVLRFGFLRWHLRFLGVAFLALLAALRLRSGLGLRETQTSGISPTRGLSGVEARFIAPWVLALCIAAELTLAHRPANPPMPRDLYQPQTDSLRALRYQLAIRKVSGYRMAALGRALPPNLAGLYGMSDIRVYNPMAPRAYIGLLEPIVTGWWGELPQLGAPANPLYRRLGVRYLLTRPGRRVPRSFIPLVKEADGWIWEVPGALPLLSLEADAGGSLTPLRFGALRHAARVQLERPTPLVTTLYQDGGWVVLAGKERLPTGLDRGTLLAAELQAGRYRLEILYRPASFLWGLVLAALGLAAALAILIPVPSRPT